MSPEIQTTRILADLLISPSTVSSLALRLDSPTSDIENALRDDEIAGNVVSRPLGCLTVWQLTANGRALATSSLITDH